MRCDFFMWHDRPRMIADLWHRSFICAMISLCVTWFLYLWHGSFICYITHSYVTRLDHIWHDLFERDMIQSCMTWLIYMWQAWLIHMWQDSVICGMTHSYVTWLIHVWHNLFVSDSFIRDTTNSYVTWLIHKWNDMTHNIHDHPTSDSTDSYLTLPDAQFSVDEQIMPLQDTDSTQIRNDKLIYNTTHIFLCKTILMHIVIADIRMNHVTLWSHGPSVTSMSHGPLQQ